MTHTISHLTLLDRDYLSLDTLEKNEYLKHLLSGILEIGDASNNPEEMSYLLGKARLAINAETIVTGSHDSPKGFHYAIHLEGGLVKDIYSKNNAGNNTIFSIFDHDVGELNEHEITCIHRTDGTTMEAYIEHKEVTPTLDNNLNDVYNSAPNVQSLPLILADFEMVDWRMHHQMELPTEHESVYRCVIEQSKTTDQVYFKLYPKILDGLSKSITLNGLSGVIDIQNGKPTISIGLEENDTFINIQSDIYEGLHVIREDKRKPEERSFNLDICGMDFPSYYYRGGDSEWLEMARSAIADLFFQQHMFPYDMTVVESNGWETTGDLWKKVCFCESHCEVDSIRVCLNLTFAPNSIEIIDFAVN